MPNIENLKKQAKLMLRWHRDGYYLVATQIRTTLPRYRHLSDPEILAASFRLSDAQEVVARQQGFDSWQALKTGIDTMPQQAPQTQSKVVNRSRTFRVRYPGVMRFLHAKAQLLDRLRLRRAAVLRSGEKRQRAA